MQDFLPCLTFNRFSIYRTRLVWKRGRGLSRQRSIWRDLIFLRNPADYLFVSRQKVNKTWLKLKEFFSFFAEKNRMICPFAV
jgi:hypothetical protein